MYLKERKKVALHVACGDITDVEIKNGTLIIRNRDDFLIGVISEGKKEIEQALNWQGLNMQVSVEKIQTVLPEHEQDISKLKLAVGNKLKIK
ncbi:MAG: hypothetical protein IJ008_00560 [Clostridia bacterium]|nr:hypothetical protein [Clostridia bacterium]